MQGGLYLSCPQGLLNSLAWGLSSVMNVSTSLWAVVQYTPVLIKIVFKMHNGATVRQRGEERYHVSQKTQLCRPSWFQNQSLCSKSGYFIALPHDLILYLSAFLDLQPLSKSTFPAKIISVLPESPHLPFFHHEILLPPHHCCHSFATS